MRSWEYNRFGVLMGASSLASCPRWPSLRGYSWPMITLFSLQGDFCATARRLLHRQVRRLGAVQDLVHVGGGVVPVLDLVRPIVDEPTRLGIPRIGGHRRQAARQRQLCELGAVPTEQGARLHDQRLGLPLEGCLKGPRKLLRPAHRQG